MNQGIKFMSDVAKDIIKINYKFTHKEALMNSFYNIMRKHGIKQGTLNKGGGRTCANYEWTMCWLLFLQCLRDEINLDGLFSVPKDLENY